MLVCAAMVGLCILFYFVLPWVRIQSLADRPWAAVHRHLPSIEISGEIATIKNYRDFVYDEATKTITDEHYQTETLNLNQIEGADLALSYFAPGHKGIAHTFITFRFTDHEPVTFSIEARRKEGEDYSPLLGLTRYYPKVYSIGSERDLIGSRSHIRDQQVMLFPGKADPQQAQALFVSMAKEATFLSENHEYYHTFLNNCTNGLVPHVNTIAKEPIGFHWGIVFPGYAGKVAYDLGFLDTKNQPWDTLEAAHTIDPTGFSIHDPDFGKKMRKEF